MRKLTLVFVVLVIALVSCKSGKEKKMEQITAFEKQLFNDTLNILNNDIAIKVLAAYVEFTEKYPNETITPEYMLRAAEVSMNLNDFQKSVEILNRLTTTYPDYSKIPESFHLLGFIYEDKLHDYTKAKQSYLEIINRFPNHVLAEDAKACIKYLGIPPDELIKLFSQGTDTITE